MKNMKTNLLKFWRKCPFLFYHFYGRELDARQRARVFGRMKKRLKQKADECWGWDIDRELYDACVCSIYLIENLENEMHHEID